MKEIAILVIGLLIGGVVGPILLLVYMRKKLEAILMDEECSVARAEEALRVWNDWYNIYGGHGPGADANKDAAEAFRGAREVLEGRE